MPLGYFSAAEAFLVLSGYVAFLVYSRHSETPRLLRKVIWRRTFIIYLFHIIGALFALMLTSALPYYDEIWQNSYGTVNWSTEPLLTTVALLGFLEFPAYHDILVLYLLPMIFLPFALHLINTGKVKIVAFLSFSVWLISQYIDRSIVEPIVSFVNPDATPQLMYIDPFSWQIYFYLGLLIAAFRNSMRLSNFGWITISVLAISGMLARHITGPWIGLAGFEWLIGDSANAPLLHIVNVIVWAAVFAKLAAIKPNLFTSRYPIFIGKHALPVFAFHSVVLFFLAPLVNPWVTTYWWADILSCLVFIFLLYIPAKADGVYRSHRRKIRIKGESHVS
jgi:hypothetical protein